MSRLPWTPRELQVLREASDFKSACATLPHRTPGAIAHKWADVQAQRRMTGAPMAVWSTGARPPRTAEERRLAQILSAVHRVAVREELTVKADALLKALSGGRWRYVDGLAWSSDLVIGRDVG